MGICGIQALKEPQMELEFWLKDFVEQVGKVRRKCNRIMSIKLVVGSEIFNVVSVYAPEIGLEEDIKRLF